ncbi:MAG: adenylate kinase [Tannerella sp.]|jgi:adenylate kinase|nr:adenylate kinase [Tannerella sp.]
MLNIVIFGAPGSGKGTQSDLIKKKYNLAHLSTGDILRAEIKNETELGRIAKSYIDKGQLLPDELICDILDHTLDAMQDAEGIIFDGFPRTIPQAEALERILAKRGQAVSILLDLQVDDDELIKRLLERGRISGRSDDNENTIQSRLQVYHTQTAPLKTHYRSKGKHAVIKGVGAIEEIFERINASLNELKTKN